MKDNLFEDCSLDAMTEYSSVKMGQMNPLPWSSRHSIHDHTAENRAGFYRSYGKRIADLLFVLVSLPVIVPVTLLCALALWLEGGQPFYRQQRLGEDGRQFSILKLRTMCRNADEVLEGYLAADPKMRAEWNLTQKLKNDPRITRIGAILRKTSLDELPQFWNVLKGEMSVVGPRPMMPDQLPLYANPAPYFDLRPGITGSWQVSDRNESSFMHRSTVDAEYHAQLSFRMDLGILFKTVGVVLRRTGY
jgi:lipopolysaccharide/colanic/teichoic acid biosynthesis glycosyltransferase